MMTMQGRWMRDGVVAGLIAYAAVALFYSALDLLANRGTLLTVNLLSAWLRGCAIPRCCSSR
jgi:hypothetical protein